MDCGSTGTAAGIDPKILDNWQTEGAYSVASWEQLGYDQPPEWDTSQESSQCDADIADLGTFQGPLNEYRRLERSAPQNREPPDNLNYVDGVVEGTGSGTISPKTIPSSADDNFHSDEAWPHFQLGFSDAPAEGILSFQQIPQSFPMIPEQWAELQHGLPTENMPPPDAIPISNKTQDSSKNNSLHQFQNSIRSLESRWLNSLESQLPIPQITPQTVGRNAPMGQEFQFKSENSSVSGDISGIYECSYSATSDDAPAFADRQLSDDDTQWKMSPHEPSSREGSQPAPKTTAFMVSEVPETMAAAGSRSRASSTAGRGGRPAALAMQSTATVRKRKTRNPGSSVDHGVRPLQIVQEDGQGGSIASADFVSPPRGARRKGPLSMVGRANAGLRRKNKDTCVQCRLNKRKCDGSSPCDACRPTLHEQPCARACFSSIVEFGTCNYISQRAVNHPTMDGTNRVRMEIPSEFDLSQLLSLLSERQGRFNIRASQAWGSLYVLDLGETYKFLKNLSDYNGNSKSTFIEFIDRRIVDSKDKSKNWLSCLADCDPMNQAYTLLSQWNNMPSRAKYSFVSLDDTPDRTMDINNPSDRREILLAAQLSRIFCRMLEVEGFRKLERDFYNIKWKQISHDTHLRFLNELGHILLTLRWRVSWWKRLGDGGQSPDPSQQHYIDRVELLCRILYVYYTCVLAKLPSWSAADVPKGKWSTYADAETVWDDFPSDSSDGGFQGWMDRGQELIEAGGVPGRVSKF
ncbi:hypothetical protein N7452_008629 [Penicillium brevicompactum]|uniref:Zn(2)-C6 fungal-type domain-containing protein n=1 Tax=Penicillium brevicompactum TaxID=5074 RepID=A0A9W9Q8H6_PENBR|nr:hypothetical protein N7452_008629 [Penicillium brevicompactum]